MDTWPGALLKCFVQSDTTKPFIYIQRGITYQFWIHFLVHFLKTSSGIWGYTRSLVALRHDSCLLGCRSFGLYSLSIFTLC